MKSTEIESMKLDRGSLFSLFTIFLIAVIFADGWAWAAMPDNMDHLVYEGYLTDSNGDPIINKSDLNPNLKVRVNIFDSSGTCIIYQKEQDLITGSKDGFFSLSLNERNLLNLFGPHTSTPCLREDFKGNDTGSSTASPATMRLSISEDSGVNWYTHGGTISLSSVAYANLARFADDSTNADNAYKLGGRVASDYPLKPTTCSNGQVLAWSVDTSGFQCVAGMSAGTISGSTIIDISGNITTSGSINSGNITSNGNISSGSITTSGNITSSGTITSTVITANGIINTGTLNARVLTIPNAANNKVTLIPSNSTFSDYQLTLPTTAGSTGKVLGVTGNTSTGTMTWINLESIGGSIALTSQVSGTLPVSNGGTGVTTLNGIVKGTGTSALTAAIAGIDFSRPDGNEGFTGLKTFDSGKFAMKGSSAGAITMIASTNTSGTYTLTLPAITDTITTNSSTATLQNKTWNGVAIATNYGGTGLTSYNTGDLIYASASNALSRLSAGTNGQVLAVTGGVPTWTTYTSSQWSTNGTAITYTNGNVGVGTTSPSYMLDVAGDINSATCIRSGGTTVGGYCSSDARLKENVQDFNPGLHELLGVRLRTYQFNGLGEMPKTGETAVGVIAQELEETNPELVKTRRVKLHPDDTEKTEIKVVDYSKFTYMLINAVKALYNRFTSIQEHQVAQDKELSSKASQIQIEVLAAKNAEINQRIKSLEAENQRLIQENIAVIKENGIINHRLERIEKLLKSKFSNSEAK